MNKVFFTLGLLLLFFCPYANAQKNKDKDKDKNKKDYPQKEEVWTLDSDYFLQ